MLVAGLLLSLLPATSQAGEGLFSRTYTNDTEPAGHFELEQTIRGRFERAFGTYNAYDSLTEIEYGITNDLQLGLYFNSGLMHAKGAPDDDDPNGATGFSRNKVFVQGVAAEFIYRVLNPVKDFIGLNLYVEPEFNFTDLHNGLKYDGTYGFEYKILFQKNFLDDRLIFAYNITLEQEYIRFAQGTFAGGEKTQHYHGELDVNNDFGVSYRVAPNWYAGWEVHNHNEYGDFTSFEHDVWWTGPAVHYAGKKFWATLGALYQIGGHPNGIDENGTFIGNDRFLRSHEQWEVTFKIGIPF
jgi:hypothetical protein